MCLTRSRGWWDGKQKRAANSHSTTFERDGSNCDWPNCRNYDLQQKCPFARRFTRPIFSAEGPPRGPTACSIGAKASPENSCLYASSHRSYILVRPRSLARKGAPFLTFTRLTLPCHKNPEAAF